MAKAKEIPYTQEQLRELLDYDPDTGVLRWREREVHWFSRQAICNNWNSKHAGKRAGYTKTAYDTGYQARYIKLPYNGDFLESRVIWTWMTDEQPPAMIDHKNRVATDNRWENIQASDQDGNMHNMSKYKTNKSGVSGVFWCKQHEKWRACVNHNKKRYHLGRFESLEEAAKVVSDFRKDRGFSEEHGKDFAYYRK